MSGWVVADIPVLVKRYSGRRHDFCYQIWDLTHAIPSPPTGATDRAKVFVDGSWQDMRFNDGDGWGRRYDPEGVGTWAKQKESWRFYAETGRQTYRVSYPANWVR